MITTKLNSGIRQGAAFYKEFAALAVPLVLIFLGKKSGERTAEGLRKVNFKN